ncbi:MAG: glucose-1-phosphate cytidylyltransferase [Pirellulales bacterium]|nr:glucose-1-phosphate cytidylyltransferase [Pirellulales bacterium]
MKTMILCGGQGTRMREETEYRPKPLVDIGGKPILWHIMKIYAQSGLNEFILCLGYKGQQIKEYFLQYHAMNHDFTVKLGGDRGIQFHGRAEEDPFSVTLADTGLDTMTGGRVRRAAQYVDEDTFLLTYGDGVADIDIGKLVDFHHVHGKLATITTMRPVSRFGMLDVQSDGQVNQFAEKPQTDAWASAGFFVLNRKVFDYLDGDACIFENEPLRRLASEGQLMAYRHEGFFFAMDTYREYLHLNQLWAQEQAPWKIW